MVAQGDLEEARHRAVQDAEPVLAPLDLEVRVVGQVDRDAVAEEPVGVEDVEPQLAVRVPRLVGEHEVYVVIEVRPRLCAAARQAQVHAVVDRLIAAVQGAVDVEHPSHALVHVLRGEAEHVVVEPVRAHRLVPVARDAVGTAGVVRGRCFRVRGRRVDAAEAGENDRPVVIVELVGEEERAGEPVVLRAVVAVVLVRRDGVDPEAAVLGRVDRQVVVLAHEDRFAVTADDELGRDRSVEGPHLEGVLNGQARVESRGERDGGIDSRVELRRDAGVVGDVALRPFRADFDRDLRREVRETLVRPERPRRTPFDRSKSTPERRIAGLLGLVRLFCRRGVQRRDRVPRQHVEARHRLRELLHAEHGARYPAGRDDCIRSRGERSEAAGDDRRTYHQEDQVGPDWANVRRPGIRSARMHVVPPLVRAGPAFRSRQMNAPRRYQQLRTLRPGMHWICHCQGIELSNHLKKTVRELNLAAVPAVAPGGDGSHRPRAAHGKRPRGGPPPKKGAPRVRACKVVGSSPQRRLPLPLVLARETRGSTDSGFPMSTTPSVAPVAPTTPTFLEPARTPSTFSATWNWPGPCGVNGTSNTPSSTSSTLRGSAGPPPWDTDAVTVAPDRGSPDALSRAANFSLVVSLSLRRASTSKSGSTTVAGRGSTFAGRTISKPPLSSGTTRGGSRGCETPARLERLAGSSVGRSPFRK